MILYFLLMRGSVPEDERFPHLLAAQWSLDPIRRYLGGDPAACHRQMIDEFLERGLVALAAGAYRSTLPA